MHNKIILDLCGGTGAWSKPFLLVLNNQQEGLLPHQDL